MPKLIELFNPRRLILILLSLIIGLLVFYLCIPSPWDIYVFCIAFGVLSLMVQTISMALINASLLDKTRGLFQGLFNAAYNLFAAVGPFLTVIFAKEPYATYLIFFITLGLMVFALMLNHHSGLSTTEKLPVKKHSFFQGIDILGKEPLLLWLIFTTCLNAGILAQTLIFWGDSYELPLQEARALPGIFALGGAILPLLIGIIADRYDTFKAYLLTVTSLIICFTVLSLDQFFEAIDYTALFLMGGFTASLFSLTYVYIGETFTGQALVKATTAFSSMRVFFAVIGVYVGGELIDQFDAFGLNWTVVAVNTTLICLLLHARKKQIKHLTP